MKLHPIKYRLREYGSLIIRFLSIGRNMKLKVINEILGIPEKEIGNFWLLG